MRGIEFSFLIRVYSVSIRGSFSFPFFRVSCFRVPCVDFLLTSTENRFRMKTDSPASWISKKTDRCGGDACIRDTRIPVWTLVNYRRLGGSDADLLRDYPALTPADLEAASEYYKSNAEEIERAIRENEEEVIHS